MHFANELKATVGMQYAKTSTVSCTCDMKGSPLAQNVHVRRIYIGCCFVNDKHFALP